MDNCEFDYGLFSVVHKTVCEEKKTFDFPGEFKPVVFTEKQKKQNRKLALKTVKNTRDDRI